MTRVQLKDNANDRRKFKKKIEMKKEKKEYRNERNA